MLGRLAPVGLSILLTTQAFSYNCDHSVYRTDIEKIPKISHFTVETDTNIAGLSKYIVDLKKQISLSKSGKHVYITDDIPFILNFLKQKGDDFSLIAYHTLVREYQFNLENFCTSIEYQKVYILPLNSQLSEDKNKFCFHNRFMNFLKIIPKKYISRPFDVERFSISNQNLNGQIECDFGFLRKRELNDVR